jgi:hypothetical protein
MKPWHLTAGVAILAGTLSFNILILGPSWFGLFDICQKESAGTIAGIQGRPLDCSIAMGNLPGFLVSLVPGLAIGSWITIFALKEMSIVTMKKF